jgi:hypothetical protein
LKSLVICRFPPKITIFATSLDLPVKLMLLKLHSIIHLATPEISQAFDATASSSQE